MVEKRAAPRKPGRDEAVQSLRQVFERVWPIDRTPVFGGLVRAIDGFDREQKRRRKHGDSDQAD